jgi:hypothetical protein
MFHGYFLYYVQGTYDSSQQVHENNVTLEVILVMAFVKQGNPIVKIFVMVRVFLFNPMEFHYSMQWIAPYRRRLCAVHSKEDKLISHIV